MNVKGLELRFAVAAPDGIEEILFFHRLALIFDQESQQVELLARKVNGLAVDDRSAVGKVQRNAVRRDGVQLIAALEDALYLGYEDIYIVGLLDVVVGAEVEAVELVLLVGAGADDKYGRIRALA